MENISISQLMAIQEAQNQQAEEQREEELEEIKSLDSSEIVDKLNDSILATEVLVSGFQMAGGFTDDATNIAYAAVVELREALENAMVWIQTNSSGTTNRREDSQEDNSEEL